MFKTFFIQHKICLTLWCLLLMLCISSCTRIRVSVDKEIDTARTHTIQQNTHYSGVLAALGPPAKLTALPVGFAFLYESTHAVQRGISLFFMHPALGLGITKGDRRLDTYVVVFNERGLVVGHGKSTKSVPLSVTVALSIPTGGKLRDLTAPDPQHRWGMRMLTPLPKTLNAANDIDAGLHGLEQRGTPIAVGQRTLERTYGKSRR
jgi:hypothetical protein